MKKSFFDKITGTTRMEGDDAYSGGGATVPVHAAPQEETDDGEGQLTIDVYQTESDVIIKSTVAGVGADDIDITVTGDMVTIRGKRTQDEDVPPENYYYQECYWGPFSRSVILPVDIDADRIDAAIKNGILTVRLPKVEKEKTRKLKVRVE